MIDELRELRKEYKLSGNINETNSEIFSTIDKSNLHRGTSRHF